MQFYVTLVYCESTVFKNNKIDEVKITHSTGTSFSYRKTMLDDLRRNGQWTVRRELRRFGYSKDNRTDEKLRHNR